MKGVHAIARRDLLSTFLVPTGWIVLAGWALVAALVFVFATFREGQPATLRAVVSIAGWALVVVAPAISMRSFAEEARLGTLEVLLTSPLGAVELVLGKLFAAIAVLAVLGVPIVLLGGVAEAYGDPDPGELATGLLGLLLSGTALVSIGMLVSTRTSSQVVAYLVTFFAWFAIILLAKGLPAVLPELATGDVVDPARLLGWMDRLRSLDPLVRLDDFAIGLLDTGNIAYFLAITVFFTIASAVSLSAPRRPRPAGGAGRRLLAGLATGVGMIGVGVSAVATTSLFESPSLRIEADLTKTRAYSLRPTTIELLESLEPGWSIRLLVAQDDTDPVTMRLVDEVVSRMDATTPNLIAERIDPVDPRSVGRYESFLEEMVERDRDTIDAWNASIARGLAAFEALRELGRGLAPSAAETVASLAPDDPARNAVERVGLVLGTLADEGGAFTEFIDDAMASNVRRPLPDWRLARASVAGNDATYASELEQLADTLRAWSIDPGMSPSVRRWADDVVLPVEEIAADLRLAASDLETLESRKPLAIATLAASIEAGDLAIVDGPRGSVIIPAWQLFPASTVRGGGDGAVIGFDRRFQGEETLAAAIRALRIGAMPRVVIVHAEDRTMLRPTDDGLEVAGIADALRTARFEVEEWMPGRTPRPVADPDRETVWYVTPPLQRSGLEYTESERALLDATRALLAEGESVMITFARSLLPLVGQADPWAMIASAYGVEVDTGRVVFEWGPDLADGGAVRTWQEIDTPPAAGRGPGSAVAGALRGKRLFLSHPTPMVIAPDVSDQVGVLAEVRPGPLRWIESDWRGDGASINGPSDEGRLASPVPVAVAIEASGEAGRRQRILLVGSGGWGLSAIVNEAGTLGGDRVVLANPGNRELALSGVSWLAGLDDLVATAASGREVARFGGVTERARTLWGLLLPIVFGGGPLLLGAGVWSIRRAGR